LNGKTYKAVDPIAQGIGMYYDYVKHPMDLGKVMTQLKAGLYNDNTDLFIADVRLVFRNCEIFNPSTHEANLNAFKASDVRAEKEIV
jgi:hypothetical protein